MDLDKAVMDMENEVSEIAKKIEEICKSDKKVDSLYIGTKIYMSPLKMADILFLGINPGIGIKQEGIKPCIIKQPEKSEFETEEYNLQSEWTYVFGSEEKINNLDLLRYKSVKTNCNFIATKNSADLKELLKILKTKYNLDFSLKQKEWINTIINYVEPRMIICEGFEAFDQLKNSVPQDKLQIEYEWENQKYAWLDGKPVLAFKRCYSTIKEKTEVVDAIYDTLKKCNII